MARFILSIDQGTSSSRAMLFEASGKIAAMAQREVKQIYPKPGWVEQDALEIWNTTREVILEASAKAGAGPDEIAAIGITNQRETSVLWDRKSGLPVYNAIVWQSRQSEEICRETTACGHEGLIRKKTGLLIDPYFSATKLSWIFKENPELLKRAEKGELAFGTIDSWLIWKLSGQSSHLTDFTNASRTLLFNIEERRWDSELLKIFSIPDKILPQAVSSSGLLSETSKELFGKAVPITGIAGDQQAALFGQRCTTPGMVKNTYGTGCFMLMNTGKDLIRSARGLLTTVAWSIGGETEYALEGGVFIAGAAVKWLRDSLKIIEKSSEIESLASEISCNEGVYLVPAFVGLGAPHWKSSARGAVFGLTLGSGRAHFARAALESLAFQSKELLNLMESESKVKSERLRVDGGACVNNLLMQFQSDILGIPVERPALLESTAAGAAYLAGLAVNFWDRSDLENIVGIERRFRPEMPPEKASELFKGWEKAVQATISFS